MPGTRYGFFRYGYVWLVKDDVTKKRMALKQILAQDQEMMQLARQGNRNAAPSMYSTSYHINVIAEAELMETVSPHPNLIEYIGASSFKVGDGHVFYILMELCTIQLSQAIAERNSNPWSEAEVLEIFLQVTVTDPNPLASSRRANPSRQPISIPHKFRPSPPARVGPAAGRPWRQPPPPQHPAADCPLVRTPLHHTRRRCVQAMQTAASRPPPPTTPPRHAHHYPAAAGAMMAGQRAAQRPHSRPD